MTTVSAGSTGSTTLTGPSTIAITPDSGEAASYVVTRSGAIVAGGRVASPTTIGPFASGDVFSLTAQRGEADYTVSAYYQAFRITNSDGSVAALSEAITEVAATASSGATVLTGSGLYAGYRCTVAAGNITVYDNTAASGKVLVPTTALTVGSFPIFGAGTNHRLTVTTGVHVVLSGAATVYMAVEAD